VLVRIHTKLLKKRQGTLCPAGSASFVNYHVVLNWCTQALAFMELQAEMFTVKASMFFLAVHHFVRNLLWQKC
jgi:hypothetical protein